MKSPWIQTFTGRCFYVLDPNPADICIEDIVHALSMICRFGGHIRKFYSVAQHSVFVASNVAPQHRKWALLHDAAEAYVGDMTSPLKAEMAEFRFAEARVQAAIAIAFGLLGPMPPEIKVADKRAMETERLQLFAGKVLKWESECDSFHVPLQALPPEKAKISFLKTWKRLQ